VYNCVQSIDRSIMFIVYRTKISTIIIDQRNEKISNKSSFGIIDIADSSTSDRIIVIAEMACLIDDGAWRC